MRSPALLTVAALMLLVAPARAAWRTTTGVAAWYDADLPTTTVRMAPTVALDGTHGVVVGGAMLSGTDAPLVYRSARLAGAWLMEPIRRLPIEFRLTTSYRGGPSQPDRGLTRAEGRLHFATPQFGSWMALATEQVYGLTGQVGHPMIGFGAWTRRNGLTFSVDLEQRAGLLPHATEPKRDSVRMATGAGDEQFRVSNELMKVALTTTRASLNWQSGRLELQSVAGVTLSLAREPKRWAQAMAAYQVAPNLAAFTTFGSRDPELYLIEPAETPRTTVGLRLSHWRSAVIDAPLVARGAATQWRARRIDEGSWRFDIKAPGARMVEVMGDFTAWEPVSLDHLGGDHWTTTVILEPGVHQVNIRVDGGAWLPPPGAPTTADGYGGTAGVLVAE